MRGDEATPRRIADITDTENSYARIELIGNRAVLMVGFTLTTDNYHVMEYVLNNMVGLEQTERMAFKDRATEAIK